MTVYMAVTADKYELPLCVSDTQASLGKDMRVTPSCIFKAIRRCAKVAVGAERQKQERFRVRVVELDD